MRYSNKLSKVERIIEQKRKMELAFYGEGLYVYENNTKGELDLPKATKSGIKRLLPGQQFQGDNYFMKLVKSNELRFIREITSPENERKTMEEKKLILDQPDKVTNLGKVEHVVAEEPQQSLNEDSSEKSEILINEDPMDGVEIIND